MGTNPKPIPQQMGSLALFQRTNHVSWEKRTVRGYLAPRPRCPIPYGIGILDRRVSNLLEPCTNAKNHANRSHWRVCGDSV